MKQPSKARKTIIAASLVALIFISLSCSKRESSASAGTPSSADFSSDTSAGPASVRVAEANIGSIETIISLSGEVSATGEAGIMPDAGGLLKSVLVKSGDYVRVDQVIAWIDPSRPGMSYAESPVRSRVSGTVTSVPVVAGNQVSVQSVIATVGNLRQLEVDIQVPERYLASLKAGMEARVISRSYPDLEQTARVTEIAPVVDPRSRTVHVTLVPDAGHKLLPGQAVNVKLVLDSRKDLVMVPDSALTERQDGSGVFTVSDGQAVWTKVDAGAVDAGNVEILSGLSAGDTVVIAGQDRITDGSALRIVGNEAG